MRIRYLINPLIYIGGISLFVLILKLKDYKNFLGKENLLSCFDCFWYARWSKELLEGVYTKIDYLRNVPDFTPTYNPPPLVSLIPYWLTKIFGIDTNLVFIFLPPITATLFIIPMYFWIKHFAPIHVFLGGALLGSLNLIYFNRTSLGRLDTDSLILFFIFIIIILITKAVYNSRYSYIYIMVAGIVFNIFMWWYLKPVFSIFFTASLIIGLVLVKENLKNLIFKTLLFILVSNLIYFILAILKYIKGYFTSYILKQPPNELPFSITANILELRPVNFENFVLFTTDNPITTIFALIGLFALIFRKFKYMAIALPILVIGFTSFFAGNRFIIYLAPFLGMGLGYFFYILAKLFTTKTSFNKAIITTISIVLVLFFSFPPQRVYSEASPIIKQELWNEMKRLKTRIENNSYIWTWWDYGNFIQYIWNRGTYVDNQSFNKIKLYFFAHSMMIYDEKKSRNLIAFITNNYFKDYGKNIKTLTDTWNLKERAYKYEKPLNKPVYIVLFGSMLQKFLIHNLGVFGTDIHDNKVASVSVFEKCKNKETIFDCGLFLYDKKTQEIIWTKEIFVTNPPYKEINFVKKGLINYINNLYENKNYKYDRMLEIIYTEDEMYFIIANRKIKNSILYRMLVYSDNFNNFELIYSKFPLITVYKVKY